MSILRDSHTLPRAVRRAGGLFVLLLLIAGVWGAAPTVARARPTLQGGVPIIFSSPSGESQSRCTLGFVVATRTEPLGLTAGHCGESMQWDVSLGDFGRRLSPVGPIFRRAWRPPGPPDWLSFWIANDELTVSSKIRRVGNRRDAEVTGWVPTAQQRPGTTVCFTGSTTKREACGPIVTDPDDPFWGNIMCARLRVQPGDSGAPVYLRPRDGRTRAVGIATGAYIPDGPGPDARFNLPSCYQSIEPVLEHLPPLPEKRQRFTVRAGR